MTPKQAFDNITVAVKAFQGNYNDHAALQEALRVVGEFMPKEDTAAPEEPELTQEQHQYNVDYHTQVVANSQAQLDKLAAFEAENPAIVAEPAEDGSDSI